MLILFFLRLRCQLSVVGRAIFHYALRQSAAAIFTVHRNMRPLSLLHCCKTYVGINLAGEGFKGATSAYNANQGKCTARYSQADVQTRRVALITTFNLLHCVSCLSPDLPQRGIIHSAWRALERQRVRGRFTSYVFDTRTHTTRWEGGGGIAGGGREGEKNRGLSLLSFEVGVERCRYVNLKRTWLSM